MKTGWKKTQLGDVIDIHDSRRIPLSGAQRSQRQGKYPYYGAQSIIDYIDDYIFDGKFLLIAEDGENLRSRKEPIASFACGKFWVNNHAHIVTAKPELADDYFIKACLNSANLAAYVTGAAQPKLSQGNLKQIEINLPDLPTQRKIAGILSAYDDLIENNLRRIKILEQMAQSLYREWFVHFRFPGHESATFKDSELGRIPDGWEVKEIQEVAIIHRGRSYKSSELVAEGGLPFINLKCVVRDGGFRRDGLKRFDGPYKDSHKVTTGDIVMAVTDMTQERRIVARAARVPSLDSEFGIVSMDLVSIESRPGFSRDFLYSYFRCSDFADHLKQHANGANVLHLSPDRIKEHEFVLPEEKLMNHYSQIVGLYFDEIENLHRRNDNLRSTRDLLLPKLLCGDP
jgi:type I restriction enzyme S subunit